MRKGFTLLEVLVVMSIMSILFAILLPAFRAAHESAERSVTMANMRQLYAGLALYRSDFDDGIYGDAVRMGLPPDLRTLGLSEGLPVTLFHSGCPSVRAPFLPQALFRQMWHEDGDATEQDWAPYVQRYQGNAALIGDINCDFRDRFYVNPLVAHRGIAVYEDGHVATIVRTGSTFPYEWWTLTLD